MNIYLVRHAIAEERDPQGRTNDAARRLTRKGIDRMRGNVRGLAVLGVELDAIWTSPLMRARETAELLSELPGFAGEITNKQGLDGSGVRDGFVAEVAAYDGENLALVGHEPDMGDLTSVLVCGSADGMFRFKKGGVARIELMGDVSSLVRGALHWLLTPKQLRRFT